MRIAGAQINLTVGALDQNEAKISEAMDWAEGDGADVLLLPELAVTGYPPEDLVLRLAFVEDNLDVVRRLAARSGRCVTVLGFVDQGTGGGTRSGRRRHAQGAQRRRGHLRRAVAGDLPQDPPPQLRGL